MIREPTWRLSLRRECAGLTAFMELHEADGGLRCELTLGDGKETASVRARVTRRGATTLDGDGLQGTAHDAAALVAHGLARAGRADVCCHCRCASGAAPPGLLAELQRLLAPVRDAVRDRRILRDLETSRTWQELRTSGREEQELARAFGAGVVPDALAVTQPILIFAPLYLNDACLNDCAYCGFRRTNPRPRMQLDRQQVLAQARILAAQGHRTIDLVTGEIPTDAFTERVARSVEDILRETPISVVNLNLGALTEEQFARLASAGAHGYHLYQETYLPEPYLALHRAGHKRDMAFRLEAPERALAAGFPALSMGILLGMAPLEEDLPRLLRHARLLHASFPDRRFGFSLPRMQPFDHDEGFHAPHPVSDDAFVRALTYLRTGFAQATLCVTTRESRRMRDQLVDLGLADKLSAGVSTRPGGYGEDTPASTEQFGISDQRSLAELVADLDSRGRRALATPPGLGHVAARVAGRMDAP